MKTQHTKGEWDWSINGKGNGEIEHSVFTDTQRSDGTRTILSMISSDKQIIQEDGANAKLIAAAPDLLEACKNLLEVRNKDNMNAGIRAIKKATE